MKKKGNMDILYTEEGTTYSIADVQRNVQSDLVTKYKALRKGQKITQTKLAKVTGIPQPNITRFESDDSNPTLEMLVKMAAALGKKVVINFEPISDAENR